MTRPKHVTTSLHSPYVDSSGPTARLSYWRLVGNKGTYGLGPDYKGWRYSFPPIRTNSLSMRPWLGLLVVDILSCEFGLGQSKHAPKPEGGTFVVDVAAVFMQVPACCAAGQP